MKDDMFRRNYSTIHSGAGTFPIPVTRGRERHLMARMMMA